MRRRTHWLLVGFFVGLLALGRALESRTNEKQPPTHLESLEEVRVEARRALHAAVGEDRTAARVRFAEACEAVWRAGGSDSEAHVRRGLEAVRTFAAADDERAQLLCQELFAACEGSTRARVQLELAHLQRRAEEFDLAVRTYELVSLDPVARQGDRDDARWWRARCVESLGDVLSAERAWSSLARDAADPCLRVRCFGALARVRAARGEHQRARECVERCALELQPFLLEQSPLGDRVRRAFAAINDAHAREPSTKGDAPHRKTLHTDVIRSS